MWFRSLEPLHYCTPSRRCIQPSLLFNVGAHKLAAFIRVISRSRTRALSRTRSGVSGLIVNQDVCVGCGLCLVYCPVGAISISDKKAFIDPLVCVECGVCYRSDACKVDALRRTELRWPRILRQVFSDPLVSHKDTGIPGRGTEEMKTNDVTGRFKEGWVGFGVELGRPSVGTSFRDVEKVTQALCEVGVELEKENPATLLVDLDTGLFKDRSILDERALSVIVEFAVPQERLGEILGILDRVSKEIDTVFSLDLISVCREGSIPQRGRLEELGIGIAVNGKTNVGLGRPLPRGEDT